MLTQEEAERILSVPKVIVENGKVLNSYILDFAKTYDFRIKLSSSDNINRDAEFLLRIRASEKMRVKISLHTQDENTRSCVFRLDFNGASHKNPEVINEYVPDKFKPFAGMIIKGNHVHYHVYDYPSGAWAIPIEKGSFPIKELTEDNYSNELKNILDAMSEVIHLESKITLTSRMMLDGMD